MNHFWQDDSDENVAAKSPQDVVDIVFRLRGRVIQVDHAWSLSQEILRVLPWFTQHDTNALHLIHVAGSGNGWQRPDDSNALLHLSNRTRLCLRVASQCVNDAEALVGETLTLASGAIVVGASRLKPLLCSKVVFARYVVMAGCHTEDEFLDAAWGELKRRGINTRKMICGREHIFTTPQGDIKPRSLMLADLDREESIQLQAMPLGQYRAMGCGIFMPHKGIDAVGDKQKYSL